jgi:hypothetical protein
MMPGGLPSAARRYVEGGGGHPQAHRDENCDNDDYPRLAEQALPVAPVPVAMAAAAAAAVAVAVAVSAAFFFQAASSFSTRQRLANRRAKLKLPEVMNSASSYRPKSLALSYATV